MRIFTPHLDFPSSPQLKITSLDFSINCLCFLQSIQFFYCLSE